MCNLHYLECNVDAPDQAESLAQAEDLSLEWSTA